MLDRVIGLYRAAFPQGPASGRAARPAIEHAELLGWSVCSTTLPTTSSSGDVDVIRIPGLGTDYSLRVARRGVIVLATQASRFRSNWSLAHELGHLALDHPFRLQTGSTHPADERATNAFAAKLLISTRPR